jgi:hypothetical protein
MTQTKSWTVGIGIAVGLAVVVWLNWPRPAFAFDVLSSVDIAGLTGKVEDNYRLRVHLTGVRFTTTLKPWTELKEPARSLWAVLSFEDVAANGGKVSNYRFQLSQDQTLPTLEDVAEGYRNLGAKRMAAWIGEAIGHKDAAHDVVPAALLAEGHAAWLACARQQSEDISRRLP